jgi:Transposase DDE domain group 1
LPANRVLQDTIGYLLKRPVGRPPHEVRRYYASFSYQAQSWKSRGVSWRRSSGIRASFIPASALSSPTWRGQPSASSPSTTSVARRSNGSRKSQAQSSGRGLSCRTFAANAVRLQLHALAYNLGNFMRTLAMPKAAEPW